MSEEEFYSRALSFDEVGKQVDIFEKEKINYEKEIERLHSIIKEVREKLNTQLAFTSSYQLNYQSAMSIIEQAKQILDKENKE